MVMMRRILAECFCGETGAWCDMDLTNVSPREKPFNPLVSPAIHHKMLAQYYFHRGLTFRRSQRPVDRVFEKEGIAFSSLPGCAATAVIEVNRRDRYFCIGEGLEVPGTQRCDKLLKNLSLK